MKESLAQDQSSPAEESASPLSELEREARAPSADPLEVSSDEIAVGPYTDDGDDDDDVVTLQMDAPLDDGEWMLQTGAHDRRRLSTAQLAAERDAGTLPPTARVWRNGMGAWAQLAEMDLSASVEEKTSVAGEPAASVARPLVPPPAAAPVKRTVPAIPSPPPPRLAPPPSRPVTSAALADRSSRGGARALGSSPAAAVGARSAGVSPPPPRIEPRPRPEPSSPVSREALSSKPGSSKPGSSKPGSSKSGSSRLGSSDLGLPDLGLPDLESRGVGTASGPPAQRVDTATSVALDLGPAPSKRSSPWRGLMAQGAAAALALVGTSYGLIRAGVFESGTAASTAASPAMHAEPSTAAAATSTLALQPAANVPANGASKELAAPQPAAEAPASAPAEPAPADAVATSAEKPAAAPTESEPAAAGATKEAAANEDATEEAKAGSGDQGASHEASAKEPKSASSDSVRSSGDERAARRAKRAARRAAAAEVRQQRRAAQDATRAEPEHEVASPVAEPGSTFDRQAAQAALTAAAEQAKNCRPIGGPSGTGTVQVTYEPSGKVASVTIVTAGFENSEAAACIQMLFRRAKVPAFNGAKTAVMRQRFDIP